MSQIRSLANWHGWRVAIGSAAVQNLAFMSLWLQPAVVDELVSERGLSVQQAGVIATAETLTISVIMLLAVRWRRAFVYLPTALVGVALTTVATLACLAVSSFPGLLSLRAVAALGFGLLMLVPNMALAGFEKPDVIFGRVYAVNLMFSAVLLFLLPLVASLLGHPPAFPTFLIFVAAMLPFIMLMPKGEASAAREVIAKSSGALDFQSRQILFLAAGSAAVGLAYGQVWAFFMVLGKNAGLSSATASTASGLALVGAIAGSLLAGRARSKAASLTLFRLSVVGSAIGLLLIICAPAPTLFIAGGIIAMFGMYFFFPTILGSAAGYDPTGRGISVINGALSLLSASGPVIAGALMDTGGQFALSLSTVAALAIAFIFFELVWRDDRRLRRVESGIAI